MGALTSSRSSLITLTLTLTITLTLTLTRLVPMQAQWYRKVLMRDLQTLSDGRGEP